MKESYNIHLKFMPMKGRVAYPRKNLERLKEMRGGQVVTTNKNTQNSFPIQKDVWDNLPRTDKKNIFAVQIRSFTDPDPMAIDDITSSFEKTSNDNNTTVVVALLKEDTGQTQIIAFGEQDEIFRRLDTTNDSTSLGAFVLKKQLNA